MLDSIKNFVTSKLPKPEDQRLNLMNAVDSTLAKMGAVTCGASAWALVYTAMGDEGRGKTFLLGPACVLEVLVAPTGKESHEAAFRVTGPARGVILQPLTVAGGNIVALESALVRYLAKHESLFSQEQEVRVWSYKVTTTANR